MTKQYFAPGRVNLIGEHLDYNGGLVLPAAITLGVTATLTPLTGNDIILRSASHGFSKQINLDDEIVFDPANDWTNYPLGVIAQLRKEGHAVPACEIVFETTLPQGSGLSSSAAVEVLTGYALLAQTESKIDKVWLANMCKQVENEFIGVKCGIMDQYSVALGLKDHAMLLDCAALRHHYIPIELGDYKLLILDSKKPRSLIQSKYNERKAQCEDALQQIRAARHDIQHLADAEMHWLDVLTDEVLQKRARHVLTENLRVKEAARVLQVNDLSTLGRLMNASHASLKNDYEVTGIEMDTLAETAQQVKGCLGARITGGGFGGCAIAIVHHTAIGEFKNTVGYKYNAVTGLTCAIYEAEIGDGVGEI